MKKTRIVLLALAAAAIFGAGCTEITLDNGCYARDDQRDGGFACVHDDLIFIRVRMPESAAQANGLYDWAGKFKVNSENEINLDMAHEDLRNWKFYFGLKKSGKDILVEDYSQGTSYRFVHESKAKKSFIPGF